MPTRLFSFLLALVVLSLPGIAQVFDMEKDRVTMTVLDGPMRFHTGDDADGKLGWTSPGFDDSSWALIGSGKSWSEQGLQELRRTCVVSLSRRAAAPAPATGVVHSVA